MELLAHGSRHSRSARQSLRSLRTAEPTLDDSQRLIVSDGLDIHSRKGDKHALVNRCHE